MRKTFRETGEVVRTPVCAGRLRTLDTLDANVSYRLSLLLCDFSVPCIERQPEILTEMKDQLPVWEICSVHIIEIERDTGQTTIEFGSSILLLPTIFYTILC